MLIADVDDTSKTPDDDDNNVDDGEDDASVFITPLLPARALCLRAGQTLAPSNLWPALVGAIIRILTRMSTVANINVF